MVYGQMLRTRGWKYRTFLFYLRLFKYLSLNWIRGEFLESYYTLMRYLDDIVDGELPLPEGYTDCVEYLSEKIHFSQDLSHPKDPADYLMLYCNQLALRLGEDISLETKDILESLLFDAKRKGRLIFFGETELMHHFHLLDIRGTIRGTLKVFKHDPELYKLLEPLGRAARFQYDLEDFEQDIQAGYINISLEEANRFGIQTTDLSDRNSPGVRQWFRHHAEEGLAFLEEHHSLLPEGNFSMLARATFKVVYEWPARKVFRKVLSEVNNPGT